MRLFVAVRPPDEVLDAVAELARPERPGVRWTGRDQWHVTLRFLGEVADPEPVVAAIDEAVLEGGEAVVGPRVAALGPRIVCLPVAGLDELARGVIAATRKLGDPPGNRQFRGHLTLARVRQGRANALAGAAFDARFDVADVQLIRSHLGPDGARYEDLYVRSLA
jgi:2'-5' RNA ligase